MDLFALGQDNAAHIVAQYAAAASACGEVSQDDFVERVRLDGRIGINLKFEGFLGFLKCGQHLTARELAAKRAAETGKSWEECFAEHQDAWRDKRLAFEAAFDEGDGFRYGALTIGGPGTHYGPFCIVARAERFGNGQPICFLKEDSLRGYVSDDGVVVADKLSAEVSDLSAAPELAGLKHAGDVALTAPERWPTMLCHGDRYIEAVFAGHLPVGEVQVARLRQDEYDALAAAQAGLGPTATALDAQANAQKLQEIEALLDSCGLELELVSDD